MTLDSFYDFFVKFIPDMTTPIKLFQEVCGKYWSVHLIVVWLIFQLVAGIIGFVIRYFLTKEAGNSAADVFCNAVIQDITWFIIAIAENFKMGAVLTAMIVLWTALICFAALAKETKPAYTMRASLTPCVIWLLFSAPYWGYIMAAIGLIWTVVGFTAAKVLPSKKI